MEDIIGKVQIFLWPASMSHSKGVPPKSKSTFLQSISPPLSHGNTTQISCINNIKFLPRKVVDEIYFSTTISKVTYCIAVWGNCSTPRLEKLENIHGWAGKIIYNLP